MHKIYDVDFYKDRHQQTLHAARKILSIVLNAIPPVDSAIDFGCGVGTWLSVLAERGARTIQGMDGPWVEKAFLVIPETCFRRTDFEQEQHFAQRYDLAISLEVAEHLQPEYAAHFIAMLTAASDFVLFSAAIPFQGGNGHFNEQWPDYWAGLFQKQSYSVVDFIRRNVWNDRDIPLWYRQNTLFFVKNSRLGDLRLPCHELYTNQEQLTLVHPDYYLLKVNRFL